MKMKPRNFARRTSLRAGAAAASILPAVAAAEDAQAGRLTLWEAVDALAAQVPLSKRNVEATLSLPLRERAEPSNPLFDFFEGPGLRLRDGQLVSNVNLRVRKDDPWMGLLVLDLAGGCIRIAEVRARYGTLEITEAPRGHSLEEATSFSSAQRWGELSFGFKERNRDCLALVVFNALNPPGDAYRMAPCGQEHPATIGLKRKESTVVRLQPADKVTGRPGMAR